jgi:hypothetical protein
MTTEQAQTWEQAHFEGDNSAHRPAHPAGVYGCPFCLDIQRQKIAAENLLPVLAAELRSIDPGLTERQSLALVTAQVAVAGVPAAGPGMAAGHEWTERQLALLTRNACDTCMHPVSSDHGMQFVNYSICTACAVCQSMETER